MTRITSEDFVPEYMNKSSTEFKKFEAKFIEEVFCSGILTPKFIFSCALFDVSKHEDPGMNILKCGYEKI